MAQIDEKRLTRNYKECPLGKKEIPPIEDILYLYKELNLTLKEVGAYFGRKSAFNWVKKYKIEKPKEEWVKSTKQFLNKKYGVDNVAHLDSVKTKKKQTALNKYGTEFHIASKHCREKSKETMLERYGVEYYTNCENFKNASEETCLKKYGAKRYSQSIEGRIKAEQYWKNISEEDLNNIVQKRKNTCIKKYGVECASQNAEIKNRQKNSQKKTFQEHGAEIVAKREATCIKKYGVTHTSKTDDFKEKCKKSNLLKRGVEYPTQDNEVIEKRRQNNISKYGVKNISQQHLTKNTLDILDNRLEEYIDSFIEPPTIKQLSQFLGANYRTIALRLKEQNLWYKVKHFKTEAELELVDIFKEHSFIQGDRHIITPLEIDLYFPNNNFGIEYNGDYWHSDKFKENTYHQNKTKQALNKDIMLYHIFEHEWNNARKKDIIISQLKSRLGDCEKIYARKTRISTLSTKDTNIFLNEHHLQGAINSKINIGLFYQDELVAVMTFGKPRYNKNYEYELLRFCSKKYTNVIGGASKLFKFFLREYMPKSIISYCNWSKGNGALYENLGFTFHTLTRPNYVWVSLKSSEIITRYQSQKHLLVQQGCDSSMSETEIMESLGYIKVFDCGNQVWIYKINS